MTIKALADELGVSKEKIKYLYRQLPKHMYTMVENRVILSEAAVDAIKNRLSGGDLASDIPVPPYNAMNPDGWSEAENGDTDGENASPSGDNGDNIGEFGGKSGENSDDSPLTDNFPGEMRLKSGDGENGENGEHFLTFLDLYKTELQQKDRQIEAKDEQIKALSEHITSLSAQLDRLTAALSERKSAADTVTAEQLTAKDEQLRRLHDTVDALTRQIADASERDRADKDRKWWQWWKR